MTQTITLIHEGSGAVKTVTLPPIGMPRHGLLDGHRCAIVYWPGSDAPVWISLSTGYVLYQAQALQAGIYTVDVETGRLIGSSWHVPISGIETLDEAMIGADVSVEHVVTGDVQKVQLIDLELSRGQAKVMARPRRGVGRCVSTPWHASEAALAVLGSSRAA